MLFSGSGPIIVGMEDDVTEPPPEGSRQVPPAGGPETASEAGPELPPPFPPAGWGPSRAPGTALGGPPPRRPIGRVVLAAVVAGLVLVASGVGIGWFLTRDGSSSDTRAPLGAVTTAPPVEADQDLEAEAVADKVEPAVVNINTVLDANPFDDVPARGRGAGTGMIVTSDGQVLTNNHVIEGATRIEITVAGRSQNYVAQFVGAAPDDDVALLQIQGGVSGLPTVSLADSSKVELGQEVLAIGNALGRGGPPTVTEGRISALDRTITISDGRGGTERLSGLIQTDAAIQPGDSGGPLVNSVAQVVGMITAGSRTSRFESGSRFGFAISSSKALSIVNEIRAGRASASIIVGEPGFLGVEVQELDAATADRLGLGSTEGVLIVGATPGTPAALVGISEGSVITAIDGQRISSIDELGAALHQHGPGEDVRVTWVDENGTHTATARLISGPAI
jgi:S1-C subfamily serine protease